MINKLLQIVAPHYCYGCGKVGVTLCLNCKYDIVNESFDMCIVCAGPSNSGICHDHRTTYDRAWCVGERSGVIERLINALKFERVSDASGPLASLLGDVLPVLPSNIVIVPLPTTGAHIRRRGYDHIRLIAKQFAKDRRLVYQELLQRSNASVQLGRNKKQRLEQAAVAYTCTKQVDPDMIYLLIDDVVTTNASVRFAAHELRRAGATTIWVAVLARQPLDKTG